MSLRKNFIWMLGNRAIVAASSLITASLIIRALGPAEMGVFAEMQTWISLFIALFCISMDSAIYHFANEERFSVPKADRCVTIAYMSACYGVTGAFFLFVFSIILPHQLSESAKSFIVLMGLIIILSMITNNLIVFIQSIGKVKIAAMIGVFQTIINCVLITVAYFFNFLNIFYIFSILLFLQCTYLIFLFLYFYKEKYLHGRFSLSSAKEIFKAGMKQHAATVSTFAYVKVNQLIVFSYAGEKQAGLFAAALNLAMAVTIIPMTLQTVLYPRVIHSNDEYEITIKLTKYGFVVWGAIVVFFALFSEHLIIFYAGKEFSGSIVPFRILLIMVWLFPLTSFASPYLIKRGAFVFCSMSAVSLGIFSIIINFLLVPRFESAGAAIATAITAAIGFLSIYVYIHLFIKRPSLKTV